MDAEIASSISASYFSRKKYGARRINIYEITKKTLNQARTWGSKPINKGWEVNIAF
jgi:hypothetical protein